MSKKQYKSATQLSIRVNLGGGKTRRIVFENLAYKGSVYTTDKEAIQKALEAHPYYGVKFQEDKSYAAKLAAAEKAAQEAAEKEAAAAAATEKAADGSTVIKVSDLGEAKDYLVQTLGVSNTQVNTKAKILKVAKANGITFVFPEDEETETKTEG